MFVKITSRQGLWACKFCRFMMIAQLWIDDAESDFFNSKNQWCTHDTPVSMDSGSMIFAVLKTFYYKF